MRVRVDQVRTDLLTFTTTSTSVLATSGLDWHCECSYSQTHNHSPLYPGVYWKRFRNFAERIVRNSETKSPMWACCHHPLDNLTRNILRWGSDWSELLSYSSWKYLYLGFTYVLWRNRNHGFRELHVTQSDLFVRPRHQFPIFPPAQPHIRHHVSIRHQLESCRDRQNWF